MPRKEKRWRANYLVTVMERPECFHVGDPQEELNYDLLRQTMEVHLHNGRHVRIEGDWPGPTGALSVTRDGHYKQLHHRNGGPFITRTKIINPVGRPEKMNGSRIVEDSKPTNARFVILNWER